MPLKTEIQDLHSDSINSSNNDLPTLEEFLAKPTNNSRLKTDKTSDKFPKNPYNLNFYLISELPFKMTPERNKELHQFLRIVNSPYQNVPLLQVERDEDILPLLSLYLKTPEGKGLNFFSVSSSDFGMSYIDPCDHDDVKKNIDMSAMIVENAVKSGEIPVYSGIADIAGGHTLMGQFVRQFLQGNIPGVMTANEAEMEELQPLIDKDVYSTGGMENPEKPFLPRGLACLAPMTVAPLTLDEKKVYFRRYLKDLAHSYQLDISEENCDFLVKRANEAFSHGDLFFKIFEVANQAMARTFETGELEISKKSLMESLPPVEPVYNPIKALVNLDEKLKKKIFGQDKAIQQAHEIILANLDDETRTKPTVLGFFGPSGVGKTALAEEISLALNNQPVTTFNMSEYSDRFKVSQMTGSSKGYVDSDEDGLLAQAVKENPKAVILLDEFEKAHEKIQKMFLGVFDKGFVFDNHAGKVDMAKTTIIITSNAGVRSNQQLGFGAPATTTYEADEGLISQSFPPELLGRIDGKIIFNPLTKETLGKIVDKFMKQCEPRFDKLGVEVSLSKQAREELIQRAQDPKTGARPLSTLIRQKIKAPIELAVYKKKIKAPPKKKKQKTKVLIQSVQKGQMKVIPAPMLNQKSYSL